MMSGVNTNTPTQPSTNGGGQDITPVWVRIPGAIKLTSIGRSRLYELINEGKVRSKVLKKRRDSIRGIRHISYDSLLEFINGSDAPASAEGSQ
jgi:hypothetical protein